MKTGTFIHAITSVCGGFLAYCFGGYDLILKTLLSVMILDYCTGILQACYNSNFSPSVCSRGVIKKIFVFFTVALAVFVQYFIGNEIPIRETVIVFYVVSEGMSCIKNIGKVIEYPEKLKDIFLSLSEKNE